MDLLKTLLIYMSMVFASSVQNAPEPSMMPQAVTTQPPTKLVATATPTSVPTPTPTAVPTPNITPNTEYKTIKVGANGEEVTKMQRRLAELGYYTGDVDGRFGNQTRRAVERFQYHHGLSADGIAGKSTLTVLYESKDVVFAPADASPKPSSTPAKEAEAQTAKPTQAMTPPPDTTTPAPTFMPTEAPQTKESAEGREAQETTEGGEGSTTTPDAETKEVEGKEISEGAAEGEGKGPAEGTETIEGQETAEGGEVVAPMAGYSFVIEGQTEAVTQLSAEGQEEKILEPFQKPGGTVYVPLLKMLEKAGILVIPSVTDQHVEYAFALGAELYLFRYDLDGEGKPTSLVFLKNDAPQVMPERNAFLQDGILYLPLAEMEKYTGMTCALNEETKVYTVTFPVSAE